jgi:hypothetical protein
MTSITTKSDSTDRTRIVHEFKALVGYEFGTGGERVRYRFRTEHPNERGAIAQRCSDSEGLLFHFSCTESIQ